MQSGSTIDYGQFTPVAERGDEESEGEEKDEDYQEDGDEDDTESDGGDVNSDDDDDDDVEKIHTELQSIEPRWPYLAGISEESGDCILHLLMKDENATNHQDNSMGKAFRYTARYNPALLSHLNQDKLTPLHVAFQSLDSHRRTRLKRVLLPITLPPKNKESLAKPIAKASAIRCGDRKENCLHLAFQKQHIKGTEMLIKLYPCEKSFNIIKELIRRGEPCPEPRGSSHQSGPIKAFDTYATTDSKEEAFVYQLHLENINKLRASSALSNATKANDRKETAKIERKMFDTGDKQIEDPKKVAASNMQRMKIRDKDTMNGARKQTEAKEDAKEADLPKPGIVRANTVQRRTEVGPKATGAAEIRKKNPKPEAETEKEKGDREYWSEQIRQELKLHCLRTRNISLATRFLYGANKEGIQLYFNYSGLPTEEADPVTFYDNFKATRFDEVLQFVEFPAIHLKKKRTFHAAKQFDNIEAYSKPRLRDLKDKKMKHIINLVVHDIVDPHDDDIIEACLSGFRIDVLDWRKPDLDPEMLCRACPDVKVLHLRWGGNNAILRAWGESEGLRTLKTLEQIYLYYDETSERSRTKIERFAARDGFEMPESTSGLDRTNDSAENSKSVAVLTTSESKADDGSTISSPATRIRVSIGKSQAHETLQGAGATNSVVAVPDQPKVTVHKWLESIDSFNEQLKTLMAAIRTSSHREDEIKVALLDDGVDFCEKEFRERIMHGKSFAYYDADKQREKQWYVSELGHGTVMAHMILRVCPMAKIYPIRLDTFRNPKKSHVEPRLSSAIQAIEAAVQNDVHMISMSWTVPQPTDAEKFAFDKALSKAEQKGILMLCSSPDEGQYSGEHYPTAWGPHKFFRIGASQADRNPYSRVLVKQVDYLFPGVDVVRTNKRDIKLRILEDNIGSTGSSNQSDGLDYTDVKKLQDIKAMKQAFQKLGAGRDSNDEFVEIWSVLETPIQSLKDHRGRNEADIKESRRIIFNLARNLVTKS
ncbi:hypothetical protein BDW74DRAFT_185133 [Aspergillus multicolor]|uniref:uncharacterized protein n=1 Tax=Aspergillus multicolor TaxID=41759 RepID=UPI003CCD1570